MIKSERFESMNDGNVYCNCDIDVFYQLLELDVNPEVALFVAKIEDKTQRYHVLEKIKICKMEESQWEEEKQEI